MDTDKDSFTDEEVHAYLKDHPIDNYKLPDFDTWARYVRDGRRVLKDQMNQPRDGRSGRSIRRADDLD